MIEYARPIDEVRCKLAGLGEVVLPIFLGIFKHARPEELRRMLLQPDISGRYVRQSLRVASWHVLRHFPRDALRAELPRAEMPALRRRALEFLLGR